ncbi:CatB-related O-acetyltransferase [Roseobacter sp. CCS2]|uniref:CatB-related O-acetyltransferase n=1 Tax=Roseobacter sp. CCS2 TaxID=391593 RepID=UPI0002E772E0|nr:CatB-related O-acetyltransferase [Roseobacter sp. CCS2]
MPFPPPDTLHPVTFPDGTVHKGNVFLNNAIKHPNWDIGDYTYASDFDPPDDSEAWVARLAPYLFPGAQDRIVIGKFGQFAHGIQFITDGANHAREGFSTFPFAIHEPDRFMTYPSTLRPGRDIRIGHDVWIGTGARIMAGAQIGNGVIVGAGAVVSGAIPDYAIVAGNRATVQRMRFDDATIATLNKIAWWDWDIAKILKNEAAIVGADLEALIRAAKT